MNEKTGAIKKTTSISKTNKASSYDMKNLKNVLDDSQSVMTDQSINNQPKCHQLNPSASPFYPKTSKNDVGEMKDKYKFKEHRDTFCKYHRPGSICLNGVNCQYVHNMDLIDRDLCLDYVVGSIAGLKSDMEVLLNAQVRIIDLLTYRAARDQDDARSSDNRSYRESRISSRGSHHGNANTRSTKNQASGNKSGFYKRRGRSASRNRDESNIRNRLNN